MEKTNKHEEKLLKLLIENTKVEPTREHPFHIPLEGQKKRKWRFDFAYIDQKIAFELEGGTWAGGRHVNPIGYAKDCEKYNMAAKQGWRVYRLVPSMVTSDYILELLMESDFTLFGK